MEKYLFMTEYHKDEDGNYLLDSDNEPIPKTICICFAHSPSECVCGAWDGVDESIKNYLDTLDEFV